MEVTGSGSLLRQLPVPPVLNMGNGFKDQAHLRYYASTNLKCGLKKEKKKKLVKGLEKGLSALYSMGFGVEKGEGLTVEVKDHILSEAAETLLAQLAKLRVQAKEMKNKRKREKAAIKAEKMAAKMKNQADDRSSSSSSEFSDSECETVVKIQNPISTPSDPITTSPVKIQNPITISSECCSNKIEVCMGGKCKKSGAMELMAEFEKKVGIEGAVVGCNCMGKCRDGPNVRVMNQRSVVEDEPFRVSKGPLCIGVGLEDVGSIVADFFGERKEGLGFLAA